MAILLLVAIVLQVALFIFGMWLVRHVLKAGEARSERQDDRDERADARDTRADARDARRIDEYYQSEQGEQPDPEEHLP